MIDLIEIDAYPTEKEKKLILFCAVHVFIEHIHLEIASLRKTE